VLGRRYRENHRARVDLHEPHSARRTRAGSHFPELDAGVGNRGPMALATRTVTHVIESSCRKRDRCALIRCADPPCCKVRIGERSNRAQTFPSRLFSN
jgi:hypothetical protein